MCFQENVIEHVFKSLFNKEEWEFITVDTLMWTICNTCRILSSLVSCRKLNVFYSFGALAHCNFGGFSPGWCSIKPVKSDLRQFKRLGIKSEENILVNPCLQARRNLNTVHPEGKEIPDYSKIT